MLRRFLVVAVAYLGVDGVVAGRGGNGKGGMRRPRGTIGRPTTRGVLCRNPGQVGRLRVKEIHCFGVKSGKQLKLGRPYESHGKVVANIKFFRDGKKVRTFAPMGATDYATVTLSFNPRHEHYLIGLWNRAPNATFECQA